MKNPVKAQVVPHSTPDAILSAYPVDTSHILNRLISEYEHTQRPITHSFRDLVHWIKVGERATHYLHSYPGKLLPQIAHFFLAAKSWLPPNSAVLDPFCGTGTVALETALSGRRAYYADVNPLAREITAAKLINPEPGKIRSSLAELSSRIDFCQSAPPPNVVNINKWYRPEVRDELARLIHCINQEPDHDLRLALRVSFSATARKASKANLRFSVPVIDKNCDGEYAVHAGFTSQVEANILRYTSLSSTIQKPTVAYCAGDDARSLKCSSDLVGSENSHTLPSDSIDAVITSPPYLSAQKYIRASSLSLGWLGYTESTRLKEIEDRSIGREHYRVSATQEIPETTVPSVNDIVRQIYHENKVRAAICANYINEMNSAIMEMHRVLKSGGKMVLVVGNNTVCGLPFDNAAFLSEMCVASGFSEKLRLVDAIKSRALTMKRNGGHSPIRHEHIMVFEK